jgi:hypothetical protein
MAMLTTINGIPLYTTIQEALLWAANNGLVGYHTHIFENQTGYMGGANHEQAKNPVSVRRGQARVSVNRRTNQSTNSTTTRSSSSGSSSSSGGGGY